MQPPLPDSHTKNEEFREQTRIQSPDLRLGGGERRRRFCMDYGVGSGGLGGRLNYKFSPLLSWFSEQQMSNANQGYEYFEQEAEPLPFFLQAHCPRKPSFDDLIDSLFPASPVPTAPSSSPKSRKPASPSPNSPAAPRKERKPKDSSKAEGVQRGHWCGQENRRYHWFLELHFGHFLNKQMRRMDKIFKTMEKFMVTREAEQCRSHHQKMEKKHGSFANILTELRNVHYRSTHSHPVEEDMRAHGVECGELMSQAQLQGASEWESERSTSHEVVAVGEVGENLTMVGCGFVDPLAEMNEDGQLFLEQLLIL